MGETGEGEVGRGRPITLWRRGVGRLRDIFLSEQCQYNLN